MTHQTGERYYVTKSTEYVEDSGLVAVYGIRYLDSGRASIQVIPGISTDQQFIGELARRLNAYGADPIHLRDLVEDYLQG